MFAEIGLLVLEGDAAGLAAKVSELSAERREPPRLRHHRTRRRESRLQRPRAEPVRPAADDRWARCACSPRTLPAFMTALPLALSLSSSFTKIGAIAAFAALLGIAILSLLVFSQARELKRLREWAGRAPERAADLEQRVSSCRGRARPAAAAGRSRPRARSPRAAPIHARAPAAAAAARRDARARRPARSQRRRSQRPLRRRAAADRQRCAGAAAPRPALRPGGGAAAGAPGAAQPPPAARRRACIAAACRRRTSGRGGDRPRPRRGSRQSRRPAAPARACPSPGVADQSPPRGGRRGTPPPALRRTAAPSRAALPPPPRPPPRRRRPQAARRGAHAPLPPRCEPRAAAPHPRASAPPRPPAAAGARAPRRRPPAPPRRRAVRGRRRTRRRALAGAAGRADVLHGRRARSRARTRADRRRRDRRWPRCSWRASRSWSLGGSSAARARTAPLDDGREHTSERRHRTAPGTRAPRQRPSQPAPSPRETTRRRAQRHGNDGLAHRISSELQQSGYSQATALDGQPAGREPGRRSCEYASGHQADAEGVARSMSVTQVQPLEAACRRRSRARRTVVVIVGARQRAAYEPIAGFLDIPARSSQAARARHHPRDRQRPVGRRGRRSAGGRGRQSSTSSSSAGARRW